MNPYLIEGPAAWSFSGGRTSGFMVRQGIEAHGGKLPDDHIIQFANVGKEPRKAPPKWATRFGFCAWPGIGSKPYWHAEHPGGELMVADCHGEGCGAFKEKRR